MSKDKVLITEEMHPSLAERLNEMGYQCDMKPGISYEDVIHFISQYRGIIVATRIRIDKKIIDAGSQLKFVARAGSGMENIDVNYATSKGIVCINSPEGNANAVAEHSVLCCWLYFTTSLNQFLKRIFGNGELKTTVCMNLQGEQLELSGTEILVARLRKCYSHSG